MDEDSKIGSQPERPGAIIPTDGAADRDFVRRTIENSLALQQAEFDLRRRIEKYQELSERIRSTSSQLAELKRQRDALNLPPRAIRGLTAK